MAIGATILVKRTAGVSSLPTLRYGEIAVSISTGTFANQGGRLWIGDEVGNPIPVGGRYYTNLLTVEPGIATAGKALILNNSGAIDNLTITGSLNVSGVTTFSSGSGFTLEAIGISSNVISSKVGTGNVIYLDPYPTGSNEGKVVIKGDLEVYGQTSNINSRTVTVEESILALSDPTSIRNVYGSAGIGTNVIPLDSISGINTGDVLRGVAALPLTDALRRITSYNTANKTVSIAGTISAGISSGTEITVVYGWDTQTNRGVSFTYNDDSVGLGTTASLTGFFGFQDYNRNSWICKWYKRLS
jgi:hypothetical protein